MKTFPCKFFLSIVLLMASTGAVRAGDEIIWPYFSYPPLFEVEDGEVSGFGIEIQNLLWAGMPEYDHKRISAPPKTIFEIMRAGRNYCAVGPVKTPEREAYLHYSIPCRFAFHDTIIMRKEDAGAFAERFGGSLARLLADGELIMGNVKGVSYGLEIDAILKAHGGKTRMEMLSGPDVVKQLLKMLVNKRIDWLMWEPTAVWPLTGEMGLSDRIAVSPVRERKQKAVVGYIACPKNAWGERVIRKINPILKREIPTERFTDFFTPWIPDDLLPEFMSLYDELLVKPARRWSPDTEP